MRAMGLCLVGVVVSSLVGCAEPVVFRPVTDVTIRAADLPPADMTVRTFVGYCESESERYNGSRAETVAVLTSGREPGRGRCRFIFFLTPDTSVTVDFPVEGPLKATSTELAGKAWDPRGWDVHWTAILDGDTITGTFSQPHDHGVIRLREVK